MKTMKMIRGSGTGLKSPTSPTRGVRLRAINRGLITVRGDSVGSLSVAVGISCF